MIPDTVKEIRTRIAKVENSEIRNGLTAAYLFAARASEIVGVASASDTTTPYGPKGSDASICPYTDGQITTEAAVFRLRTAKRKGLERFVALPLKPEYEPLTRPLYEYFKAKGDGLAFEFTRQTLHAYAVQTFVGLEYDIERMNVNGNIRERHKRDAAIHFLRHIRASELSWTYHFEPQELASYCGWTLRNAGYSQAMERYQILDWQGYFRKLLKPYYATNGE